MGVCFYWTYSDNIFNTPKIEFDANINQISGIITMMEGIQLVYSAIRK